MGSNLTWDGRQPRPAAGQKFLGLPFAVKFLSGDVAFTSSVG